MYVWCFLSSIHQEFVDGSLATLTHQPGHTPRFVLRMDILFAFKEEGSQKVISLLLLRFALFKGVSVHPCSMHGSYCGAIGRKFRVDNDNDWLNIIISICPSVCLPGAQPSSSTD